MRRRAPQFSNHEIRRGSVRVDGVEMTVWRVEIAMPAKGRGKEREKKR